MHMLLRHSRGAGYFHPDGRLTDGQLLEQFLAQRDEAAFEELVRRYGPMVLGVCRRVLRHEQDVEDAFQATFLVLVRKARSLQSRELVGHWLYGVAYRTALRARVLEARRREKVKAMTPRAESKPDAWHDVVPVLDQELNGLPEKYRMPVVLCDLEGKSRKEVASVLGWSEGTLSGRLARARALLQRRLSRRGVSLSVGTLAALIASDAASAGLSEPLIASTIKAMIPVAAGQATTTACVSFKAAALTEGVVRTLLFTKLKTTAVLCTVAALAIGTSGVVYQAQAGKGNSVDLGRKPRQLTLARAEDRDRNSHREAPAPQVYADEQPREVNTDPSADAARRPHDIEAQPAAILEKANAQIQARRDKLIAKLQTLEEIYAKAGILNGAVAIREQIGELQATVDRAHNLLVNGSFEEGPPTPSDSSHNTPDLPKGSTDITGWVVTEPICIPTDSLRWRAAKGARSLALSGMGATISQRFTSRKGQKYRVTFKQAGDPFGGPGERRLRVSAAGQSAEFVFDIRGKGPRNMGWVRRSWVFTAETDQTTLAFTCLTEGVCGVALDDVVVAAVKE
jgi:RNA polymerase sigma factor (sigma-70 family)